MLLSIALIFLIGMTSGWLCSKLRLPSLTGMILAGAVIGPYILNFIDDSVLSISSELRKIALIIILIRAGLTLNISDLKKVGRPAVLMCFVPACFEISGMIILAPKFLGVSLMDALMIGAVVGAVSPAVIIPEMIKIIDEKRGTEKGIPQLILAGASVDDVFVIVIFTVFMGLAQGKKASLFSFVNIPVSIILGTAIGIASGVVLSVLFEKRRIRDTAKCMIILSIAFILVYAEDKLETQATFSALVATMFIGIALRRRIDETAGRLSLKFNKLWFAAEIFLFVLVGAAVDLRCVYKTGFAAAALILCVLLFRMAGVFLCLIKTKLTFKERIFCMLAYLPKATVQAAIGGIPLSAGLSCGDTVMSIAVLSILITAPLGAFLIDFTYTKLLEKEQ